MKPRKRLREDDTGDNDVDADGLEPRKELHPVLQFAVSAEDRRHMEDLELAVVDPEHYNDVSDDASLDAGLFLMRVKCKRHVMIERRFRPAVSPSSSASMDTY